MNDGGLAGYKGKGRPRADSIVGRESELLRE
jgi:hypothetical protein